MCLKIYERMQVRGGSNMQSLNWCVEGEKLCEE